MYVFGFGIMPNTQVTAVNVGSSVTINNPATEAKTDGGIFSFSIFPTISSPVTFGKLAAGQNVKFGMIAINSTAPMGIDSGLTPTYAVPSTANFTRKHVQNIAGSGSGTYMDGSLVASFNGPSGLAIDSNGDVYVADRNNHRIRKITNSGSGAMVGTVTTIAGTGVAGSGDGAGLTATFNQPSYLALNAAGNILYVSDVGTNSIRRINMTTSANTVSTLSSGTFSTPQGICVDSNGIIYVVDSGRTRIVRLTSTGTLVTVAGSVTGFANGPIGSARFNGPRGLAINAAGNTLYVADTNNQQVRVIRFTPLPVDSTAAYEGTVSILAGGSTISASGVGREVGTSNSGDASNFGVAGLNGPTGITVDSVGNLYVTDNGNSRIRKITPGGYVTIIGGFDRHAPANPTTGYINGDAWGASRFSGPTDIKVDSNGNLYVADTGNHRIRKIADIVAPTVMAPVPTPYYMNPTSVLLGWTGGTVPGISYSYKINGGADIVPSSIVSPLMITNLTADTTYTIVLTGTTTSSRSATWSFRTPAASTVPSYFISTVAGGGSTGSGDGIGYGATFNAPRGCVYDDFGNLYIADTANHTIRMVAGNTVTTIAGTAGSAGATDGVGAAARFSSPIGLAIEDNTRTLYVADSGNHRIRKIVITTSGSTLQATVSTVAGIGTIGITDNLNAVQAQLSSPAGVFVGNNNRVYIADTGNNRVRILRNQSLTTLIDVSGGFGSLSSPTDVVEDAAGNIYVSNSGNHTIVRFNIALFNNCPIKHKFSF
jgi:sugar lactone lactonase YvrE